jgi:exopolyphosphatase/pppGpp-phosphohydrolase
VVVDRDGAEEVFRALATESRADRLHNPGLEPARVDTVLAASCVLVGMMRRLQLDAVTIEAPDGVAA